MQMIEAHMASQKKPVEDDAADEDDEEVDEDATTVTNPSAGSQQSLTGTQPVAGVAESQSRDADADPEEKDPCPFPRKHVQLVIGDVNYGCNKSGARDDIPWDAEHFRNCFLNIIEVNKCLTYTVIFFVIDAQIETCRNAWREVAGTGPEGKWAGDDVCVWIKDNVKDTGGPWLTQTIEHYVVMYYDVEKKRKFDHYNFQSTELRPKHIIHPRVIKKFRSPDDQEFLSPYQKPVNLFAYFINHFTRPGAWVWDVTGGSGICIAP